MNRAQIILVNWNGWQDTTQCLESLRRLTYANYSVIICDNGSTDNSVEKIKAWAEAAGVSFIELQRAEAEGGIVDSEPWLTLIRVGANLGFAGGNNMGLRYALKRRDVAYAWLLNNDTVVEPDALSRLIERMGQQPAAGMCGSTIRYFNDPERIQALGGGFYCRWLGFPWHYGRFLGKSRTINRTRAEACMNYVEGASLLVSRDFVETVGLMSEEYFLYFEEADWAVRANGRYRLAYAADSVVYHKVGASIGTSSNPAKKSLICDYYNVRNRLFFTRRYYPLALPTVYLVVIGTLFIRLLLGKWDRAVMICKLLFRYSDSLPAAAASVARGVGENRSW